MSLWSTPRLPRCLYGVPLAFYDASTEYGLLAGPYLHGLLLSHGHVPAAQKESQESHARNGGTDRT